MSSVVLQAVIRDFKDIPGHEQAGHVDNGTVYTVEDIKSYSHERGFELHHFLDQHIFKALNKLSGKKVVDIGCGAAPHSIYAARHGAEVDACDTQPKMIEEAQSAIVSAGLAHKVTAKVIENNLPYGKSQFDHALSINVGCNLPSTIFSKHFAEISSVLKKSSTATIAAPYSLDVIFTDGTTDGEKAGQQIQAVLSKLPRDPVLLQIKEALNQLTHVLSATFTICDGRLLLVTPETKLVSGQSIYRKLPNCVIPNYYHSDSEYQETIKDSDLKIIKIEKHCLKQGKENLNEHMLGPAYETHAPFIIYHLQKI